MPCRDEVGFSSLMPCSRVRLVTADGDINLFVLDPNRDIFVIEYCDGRCFFCLITGSVKGGELKQRKICPDCQLQIIVSGKESLSSPIIAIKRSNDALGMTQNVFRRAIPSADI